MSAKSNSAIRRRELNKALKTKPIYNFNSILKDGLYTSTYKEHSIEVTAKYVKDKYGYRFKSLQRPYKVGAKNLDGTYVCVIRVRNGKAVVYKRTNLLYLMTAISGMLMVYMAHALSKIKKKKNG